MCKCVADGTADARRPARLVVPDVERVLVGDLFGSQIQGDLIGASQWRIYQGVADLSGCGEGVRVGDVRQLSLAAFSFPSLEAVISQRTCAQG